MILDELYGLCGESTDSDWRLIPGPPFLHSFLSVRSGPTLDGGYELHHVEHEARAALRSNLSVGIAWGMEANPGVDGERELFEESWTKGFPNSDAYQHFVDFLYCGNLVAREYYVSVDGGRCRLPLPDHEFVGELGAGDPGPSVVSISRWQLDFFRVLNALQSTIDYDGYVERAGFDVRD